MPYIPHSKTDVAEMLQSIGVDSIDALFDEIPADLIQEDLPKTPGRASEMEVSRLLARRASQDGTPLCFAGAGAYEHHIPAAVWQIATRGEFYSAYTPYQAEASQGTLQLIYEYQTMMTSLTGMEVSNASLYDGATGVAESVLMAVRANRKSKSKRILIPTTVNPTYRKTTNTIVKNQKIVLEEINFDKKSGIIDVNSLPEEPGDFAALVIAQPNFFGALEDVDALTDWAHKHNALVIASVNPMSLAALKAPGSWGEKGADIVCGEGQPFGIPLASGGPYFGFMCSKQVLARQLPGRIVGRTVDLDGKEGFTLTLQAREQHIRRSKATSNICTNQGLMVTAATIYLSIMGFEGIRKTAITSHQNMQKLIPMLSKIDGVNIAFNNASFHEVVIELSKPADDVLSKLADNNIVGGVALEAEYPDLKNTLLVCVTETKSDEDLTLFCEQLKNCLN